MTSIDDFTIQALGLVEIPAPPAFWSAVAGYATCCPELHHGADGHPWVRFGLAANPKIDEDTAPLCYVVAFGELAEKVATSVAEGIRLVVIGRLEGAASYSWTLRADDVGISVQSVLADSDSLFPARASVRPVQPDFEENDALVQFAEPYLPLPPASAASAAQRRRAHRGLAPRKPVSERT